MHQEDIMILNMGAPSRGAPNFIKQPLGNAKLGAPSRGAPNFIKPGVRLTGDVNIPLSLNNRSSQQKQAINMQIKWHHLSRLD